MGNPLVNAQRNTSKPPPAEQYDPPYMDGMVTPIPESYAGDNNPYRGTESHGVHPTVDPTNTPGYREDGRPVALPLVPDSEPPAPLPVRIVNEGGKEFDKWRVATAYAIPQASQIVGALRSRTTLRIRNNSETDTVYVSPDSSCSPFTGYPLRPGAELSLNSTDPVYACTDPAVPQVILSVLWEYTVEG